MKILITAGPTREPIDPVRFLSNRSSGKMGYAIAQAALDAGHEVTLISGPVCIALPAEAANDDRVKIIRVTTSDEMFDAVHAHFASHDLAVLAAAVSDFKPAQISPQKLKKQNGIPQLSFVPTRDILASLSSLAKKKCVVGFAAETESLAENALKKLREKKCDLIIGNDVSRMGTCFESDCNELALFFPDGKTERLPRETKSGLAKKLIQIFEELVKKR